MLKILTIWVLIHTFKLHGVKDLNQDVLQESNEGKIGHNTETEVAFEDLFLSGYVFFWWSLKLFLSILWEFAFKVAIIFLWELTGQWEGFVDFGGGNILIFGTDKIWEIDGEAVQPLGGINLVKYLVGFVELKIRLLPPEEKDITVEFFVVLENDFVKFCGVVFLPYVFYL